MHVVIAAEGSTGDVHPMLVLGEAMRAVGHRVTLCGPSDFDHDARSRGLTFVPASASARETIEKIAAPLHAGGLAFMREARFYAKQAIESQFAVLPDVVRDADLVLGAGVQLAAPSIAERCGVPYRYVAYCPMLLASREHPPLPIERQNMPRWMNALAWRAARLAHNLGERPVINRHRRALGLGPIGDAYRYFIGARPILAADEALAPAPRDFEGEVTQIPALVGANRTPLADAVLAFVERPCVYIGFGSMPDPDPATTTRVVLDAVKRAGVRAILGSGWAGLGRGTLPGEVLCVESVSHAELFPRVSLAVHHGGAGTTTTALRAGVPQVVVPHLLDQLYFGTRVARLGLGPAPLPRRALSVESLAAKIRHALDDAGMAERAQEIAKRPRVSLEDSLRAALGSARTLPPAPAQSA